MLRDNLATQATTWSQRDNDHNVSPRQFVIETTVMARQRSSGNRCLARTVVPQGTVKKGVSRGPLFARGSNCLGPTVLGFSEPHRSLAKSVRGPWSGTLDNATKWLSKWLGCEPRLIVVSLDS